MGFMGIRHIGESDNAFDFMAGLSEQMLKQVKKQVKNNDNPWNTPGYIDVALSLKSLMTKESETFFKHKEWLPFWEDLEKRFTKNKPDWNQSTISKDYNKLYSWVKKMNKKCKEY